LLSSWVVGQEAAVASSLKRQAGPNSLDTPFTRLLTRTLSSTFCGRGLVVKFSGMWQARVAEGGPKPMEVAWLCRFRRE
jgi:hypothetical protein